MRSTLLSSNPIASDLGLLLLRIISGGGLLTHGYSKFQKVLAGNLQFGDPIYLGQATSLYLSTFAEFLCSILLILGLFTRLATIPLIINMAVILLFVHAADGFEKQELPLIYLGAFLALFLTGPGRFSLDRTALKK